MATTTPEFLDSFFQQIESQVQFGDSKASLLVAGDAVLLAINGGLIGMASGCPGGEFSVSCVKLSLGVGLATLSAVCLALALVFALLAARPSTVHRNPPAELLLLSHVARLDREAFVEAYTGASSDELIRAALYSIHGKARYAARKFRLLRKAVDLTLLSIGLMFATVLVAVIVRIFS